MSPTARSLKLLRDSGETAQVVEHFNCFTKRRHDLFNVIDIVSVNPQGITGIQTTSASNKSARVKKSRAEPKLKAWLEAGGRFFVHGWRKSKKSKKWEVNVQQLTLEDLIVS